MLFIEEMGWRTLPERFGHSNSVRRRFHRLGKAGVFETLFDALASMSDSGHLIKMIVSSILAAVIGAEARR